MREGFKSLSFGAPDSESAVAAVNFGGHLVPFTTAAVADDEVAVAHGLGRVPRLIKAGLLNPALVGSAAPSVMVTQAADATYLYVSSDAEGVECLLYVE